MSDHIVEYQGNCHCGAVKFIAGLPEITETKCCDCSICAKKGLMWNVPTAANFRFVRGEDILRSYKFGKGVLIHKFCPTCGTQVVGLFTTPDGDQVIGINTRALAGVDHWSLKVNMSHASTFEPRYSPPQYQGPLPDFDGPDLKLYTGSCHCGAVRLALKTAPLPTCQVKEDNCSICIRNAFTFVYPKLAQVSISGEESSTAYGFGRRFMAHHFCATCGVPTHSRVLGPPKAVQDRWSEEVKRRNASKFDMLPVNLRVLEGVEWSQLSIERDSEEAAREPLYTVD